MKSAIYWTGFWDARKSATYELIDLIVDIQNDALHGTGGTPADELSSTPSANKSATPDRKNEAKQDLRNTPILVYSDILEYSLFWGNTVEPISGEKPIASNRFPKRVEAKVRAALFLMGFRATEPVLWINTDANRWVLVPRNEWKDDTQPDNPQLPLA
jgi:hypothetical protein